MYPCSRVPALFWPINFGHPVATWLSTPSRPAPVHGNKEWRRCQRKNNKIQQSTRWCLLPPQTSALLLETVTTERRRVKRDKEEEQKTRESGRTHLWSSAVVRCCLCVIAKDANSNGLFSEQLMPQMIL